MTTSHAEQEELRAEAAGFLRTLYPDGTVGGLLSICHVDPSHSKGAPLHTEWFAVEAIDRAAAAVVSLSAKHHVWFGAGLRRGRVAGRGKSEDVVVIPGLWGDLDFWHPVHKKSELLPPTLEDALTVVRQLPLPPTVIVHSGHGIQPWWLFKEPMVLETPDARAEAQALLNRLKETLKRSAAARNWAIDAVMDLPRLMRPAGALNIKDPAEPVAARVIEHNDYLRYDPSDFDEQLSDLPGVDQAQQRAGTTDRSSPQHDDDTAVPETLTDEQVINRAVAAQNGEKFSTLYYGDWRLVMNGTGPLYPSESEAVEALCCLLAFWTRSRAQLKRIADRSALCTGYAKWWDRADVPARAIARAMKVVSSWYGKDKSSTAAPDADDSIKLRTDIGNAARFVRQHGQDVRFCYQTGNWYVFNGHRWIIDERGNVTARAKRTALSIYREAAGEPDEAKRGALLEHGTRSQKRDRLIAMVELAKPELAITTDQLDADPWLLNCRNGTVDLRSGQLRRHRREDFITKVCRASYAPGAEAPVFYRFLDRIFRTYPDLAGWLPKVFGYAATGFTSEQVMFFLFGTGANGKTTLLDAIAYALGDYAGKADRELLTHRDGVTHPTNVADLMGRRMVVCSETNDGRRFDEARLKDLVGETTLKARFMRCDFFEFTATHKIFLYSNHRMIVRGQDHGFWRRMREVPFVETVADDEKDVKLPEKLQAEADGILTWIVAGAARWYVEGIGCPPEVADATNSYRSEMDSVGAFLDECCVTGQRLQATARDLYAGYVRWCEDSGEKPLSQKRLGTELANRSFVSDRDSYTGRKKWLGVGLRARAPDGE